MCEDRLPLPLLDPFALVLMFLFDRKKVKALILPSFLQPPHPGQKKKGRFWRDDLLGLAPWGSLHGR